jgi:putative ABC transport system permease protein
VALSLRRLETVVSVVSVSVGVFLVVTVLHLARGLDLSLAGQLESAGARTLFVTKFEQGLRLRQRTALERRRADLEIRHAEDLRARLPFLRAVSPETSVVTEIRWEGRSLSGVTVIGGTADYLPAHNAQPRLGRFLSAGEVRSRRPVCVVGASVARALFGGRDPVGARLSIEGRSVEIVGVAVRRGSPVFGQGIDRFVLLPAGLFATLGIPRRFTDFVIAVEPEPGADLAGSVARVRHEMRQIRRVRPGEPDDFAVTPQAKLLDLYRKGSVPLFAGMVALGAVALVVGAMGVLTVTSLGILERKAEIGIRRAVGARRRDIFATFLAEALLVTAMGGALGCALSAGVSALFFWAAGIGLGVFWPAIAAGLLASGGTGLLAGVVPATRAARLDPAVVLQYE